MKAQEIDIWMCDNIYYDDRTHVIAWNICCDYTTSCNVDDNLLLKHHLSMTRKTYVEL